jgi:hypothetical protein
MDVRHYSLAELLRAAGFREVVQQRAASGLVFSWSDFHLDTDPDATIYKPGSLYMESVK